jgi:hypothetical protein
MRCSIDGSTAPGLIFYLCGTDGCETFWMGVRSDRGKMLSFWVCNFYLLDKNVIFLAILPI